MKKLVALNNNPVTYIDRYTSIRDSKHLVVRNQLIEVHDHVINQFDLYINAIDNDRLSQLTSNPHCVAVSPAFRACYDSHTKALGKLKADIKNSQPPRVLKYCPMCGTTLPATFDHYLPAIRFPEFAVFPLNLVPCCARCNSIKDDDWLNAAGNRQFLHAFVDDIPDADFLIAILHELQGFSGVGVTFDLNKPAEISDHQWAILESHFRRLHLIDRYNELGNDEIAEILADCRIHLDEGGEDVNSFLAQRANERARVHGRNHWQVVLMRELAAHPNLSGWMIG